MGNTLCKIKQCNADQGKWKNINIIHLVYIFILHLMTVAIDKKWFVIQVILVWHVWQMRIDWCSVQLEICRAGVGNLQPTWTFDMAHIIIFVTQIRVQHHVKTMLQDKLLTYIVSQKKSLFLIVAVHNGRILV